VVVSSKLFLELKHVICNEINDAWIETIFTYLFPIYVTIIKAKFKFIACMFRKIAISYQHHSVAIIYEILGNDSQKRRLPILIPRFKRAPYYCKILVDIDKNKCQKAFFC
jgi:hypothetical protein